MKARDMLLTDLDGIFTANVMNPAPGEEFERWVRRTRVARSAMVPLYLPRVKPRPPARAPGWGIVSGRVKEDEALTLRWIKTRFWHNPPCVVHAAREAHLHSSPQYKVGRLVFHAHDPETERVTYVESSPREAKEIRALLKRCKEPEAAKLSVVTFREALESGLWWKYFTFTEE